MMTFMQMMNNQMQQFMQGMRQTMQQNIVAQQQQQAAPVHSNGYFQNRLDERCFRRLDRFSNKNDVWKEWRLHFLTVMGECNSKFVELSAQLQSRLSNLTTKSALGVVESTQGNGCEAWRLLSQTFDPMTDAARIVGHQCLWLQGGKERGRPSFPRHMGNGGGSAVR